MADFVLPDILSHVEHLLEPEQALVLGEHVLKAHRKHVTRKFGIGGEPMGVVYRLPEADGSQDTCPSENDSDELLLSREDQSIATHAVDAFRSELPPELRTQDTVITSDIIVGSPDHERWHVDQSYEYRGLLNLSAFALPLLIATEWSADDFHTELPEFWNLPAGPPVERQAMVKYSTGDAVLFDNLDENPQLHLPHAGLYLPNKAILRLFAWRSNNA